MSVLEAVASYVPLGLAGLALPVYPQRIRSSTAVYSIYPYLLRVCIYLRMWLCIVSSVILFTFILASLYSALLCVVCCSPLHNIFTCSLRHAAAEWGYRCGPRAFGIRDTRCYSSYLMGRDNFSIIIVMHVVGVSLCRFGGSLR